MKMKLFVGLAMASLFVAGAMAGNDDPNTPPGESKDGAKSRPSRESRRGGMFGRSIVDQITKACTDLTDDQKTQLKTAGEELKKAGDEWKQANEEKLKAAMDKMRQAYQSRDEAAMTAAKAEMDKLRAEQITAEADARKKVVAVLTAEQKQTWQQAVVLQAVQMASRGLNLTEDQMTKVKEIIKTAVASVDFSDAKVEADTIKSIVEKIKAEVLTDEQKAASSRPSVPPVGGSGGPGGRGGEGGGQGGEGGGPGGPGGPGGRE